MKTQEITTGTQEMVPKRVQALYAIEALERAAKVEILAAGEEGKPFCSKLRKMAEAFRQHYGLDATAMAKYDAAIQAVETGASVPDAVLTVKDIASLLEVTIDFCDSLDSAAEIMRRFKLLRDVMYLCGELGD